MGGDCSPPHAKICMGSPVWVIVSPVNKIFLSGIASGNKFIFSGWVLSTKYLFSCEDLLYNIRSYFQKGFTSVQQVPEEFGYWNWYRYLLVLVSVWNFSFLLVWFNIQVSVLVLVEVLVSVSDVLVSVKHLVSVQRIFWYSYESSAFCLVNWVFGSWKISIWQLGRMIVPPPPFN